MTTKSVPATTTTPTATDEMVVYATLTQRIADNVLAGTLSPQTLTIYRREASRFLIWLAERWGVTAEEVNISKLTRDDLLGYRNWLAGRIQAHDMEASSAKLALTVARQLAREAYASEALDRDITIHIAGFKAKHDSPYVALDAYWARRLYEAVPRDGKMPHLRDRAILALMLGAGLRAAEVGVIQWRDIGVSNGHHILTVRGKGDKRAVVKLRTDVADVLLDYCNHMSSFGLWAEHQDRLSVMHPFTQLGKREDFFDEAGTPVPHALNPEKGLTRKSVWELVKRYAAAAGVPNAEKLSPHCLRATFATLLIEGGATVDQVQVAMRHEDGKTTWRYIKRMGKLHDAAVDHMPKEMDFTV